MSSTKYSVGDEVCLVKNREGVIKFKGPIEGKKGSYYGVEVVVGTGKHSGLYKNMKYFECEEGQGIFVEDKHILYKFETNISSEEQQNNYNNTHDINDNFYETKTPQTQTQTPTELYKPNKKSKKSKAKKPKKQTRKKKKLKKKYITQLQYVSSDEELDLLETEAATRLLSLPKSELIKKCKHKGIVCLGKKEEMVLKLLTTKTTQKYSFERVTSVTLNDRDYKTDYLTMYECNYYFINGFIKENINTKLNQKIKLLLLQYMDSVIPKFDLCPNKCQKEIKDNGSIIKRSKSNASKNQYLFGCSKGFASNSGVYRFSIKMNKLNKNKNKNKSSKNLNTKEKDEIGIIANRKLIAIYDEFDDTALWNVDCNSYYVSLNEVYGTHKISSGGFNSDKIGLLSNDSIPIKRDDIITVVLNTNRSRLYFEKNGKRFCESFDIIPNCTYYACVSCAKQNEYEIVFF